MPLSNFTLSTTCGFDFTNTITGWADLTQGTNSASFTLGTVDTDTWNQCYAGLLTIAGGSSTTIDLKSFTDLTGTAVALTEVLGIVVKVAPTVSTSPNVSIKITPGTSNGLVWLAGATDGLVLAANENFSLCGDPDAVGVTVDATHKTLKFANTGTDSATVRVVILGSTL